MLLGALVVPSLLTSRTEAVLKHSRLPELPSGEMAWTKVSNGKLQAYKRFIDTIFGPRRPIQFHLLCVDTHRIKDKIFNGGSREAGFNKELYQLILKCWRLNRDQNFHVYLDRRKLPSTSDKAVPLSKLRDIINLGIRKKSSGADWPVRRIQFRDGLDSQFIQAIDLVLGAVGYHLNGHRHAQGASAAKSELSDHVLSLAKVADPLKGTAAHGRFTIWHRQLR